MVGPGNAGVSGPRIPLPCAVPRKRSKLTFVDLRPPADSLFADVVAGLSAAQKALPPKYFYDARGCELFNAICDLPEYYVTRAELSLMRQRATEMARALGPGCALIEVGCGNSEKTRLLLQSLAPVAFVPVDIAWEQLESSCDALCREFPRIRFVAVRADFSQPIELPELGLPKVQRRALYFPGSTIGNFTREEAAAFLRRTAQVLGSGGAALIGVDLKKPRGALEAAYNDSWGVTGAFNLNLLERINRELQGNFDLGRFRHHAFYNDEQGRIEMHLVSLARQTVTIGNHRFEFAEGESVLTEYSYKYSVEEFQLLAAGAGYWPAYVWTDANGLFSVHYIALP